MKNPLELADEQLDSFNRMGIELSKKIAKDFLLALYRPIATLTEALYRRNFGERYFTSVNVLFGALLIFLASVPSTFYQYLFNDPRNLPVAVVPHTTSDKVIVVLGGVWFLALFIVEKRERRNVLLRYKKGILWHSYSYGTSFLDEKFPIAQHGILAVLLGVVVGLAGGYRLGILLALSGLFSRAMRLTEMAKLHKQVLDSIDSQLEGEHLSQAIMTHSRPQQTEGFTAALPAHIPDDCRKIILQKLSPGARPSSIQVFEENLRPKEAPFVQARTSASPNA